MKVRMTTVTKPTLKTLLLGLTIGLLSCSSVFAGNILFMSRTLDGSGVPSSSDDGLVYDFLTNTLGHTVTGADTDIDFVGGGGNWEDYDAIIVSSTANSGNLRNANPTLKDTTVGVFSWEYDYMNNDDPTTGNTDQDLMLFEITGVGVSGSGEEAIIDVYQSGDGTPLYINLLGGNADLMYCLQPGLVPILDGTGTTSTTRLQSVPTAGVQGDVMALASGDGNPIDNDGTGAGLGTGTGSDRSFLLYADTGDALVAMSKDGIANSQPNAPGRRLFFPLDNSGFGSLTTDYGYQMFSNSLSWVMGETPTAEFVSHVPEPSSVVLSLAAAAGMLAVARRRRT